MSCTNTSFRRTPSVWHLYAKGRIHADVLPGGQSAPQPISVCLRPPVSSILSWQAGPALSPAAHPPQSELTFLYFNAWCQHQFYIGCLYRGTKLHIPSPFSCAVLAVMSPQLVSVNAQPLANALIAYNSFSHLIHVLWQCLSSLPFSPFFISFHPDVSSCWASSPLSPQAHAALAINVTRT